MRRQKNRGGCRLRALAWLVCLALMAGLLPAWAGAEALCGREEHAHGAECFSRELTCPLAEDEAHAHGEDCWQSVPVCALSEHTHTPACFAAQGTAAPEPSASETPAPRPLPAIVRLDCDRGEAQPGERVVWSYQTEAADRVTYELFDRDGAQVAGGEAEALGQIGWTAEGAGRYTLRLVAESEAGSAQAESHLVVREELKLSLLADVRSCFGGDTVGFRLQVSGGEGSCTFRAEAEQGGEALFSGEVEERFSLRAATLSSVSTLRVQVVCTDAQGRTASAVCEIPCALRVIEQPWEWEQSAQIERTGCWPEDLIAVARTQLGYRASEENFIVDEQGERHGYTRYGGWWRASYSGWCAMYVSFCLNYAGIPESRFPWEAHCQRWVEALEPLGLYVSAQDYEPKRGDLVFFDWDGRGSAGHVGIVSSVSEDTICVLEGNHLRPVCEREYERSLANICGYGLVNSAYEVYYSDCLPDVEPELLSGAQAEIAAAEANLREGSEVGSRRLGILSQGEAAEILSVCEGTDGRWYEVKACGLTGYVRADLMRILSLSAAPLRAPEQAQPAGQANRVEVSGVD